MSEGMTYKRAKEIMEIVNPMSPTLAAGDSIAYWEARGFSELWPLVEQLETALQRSNAYLMHEKGLLDYKSVVDQIKDNVRALSTAARARGE